MSISFEARLVADGIIEFAAHFGAGLDEAFANVATGHWTPGALWDQAILGMRNRGGALAENLAFLNEAELSDELMQLLPAHLRDKLADQLSQAKYILDEIHTDQGGEFAQQLSGFRAYGDEVAAEIREILRKADEAEATGARNAVEGQQALDWTVKRTETAKETVKVTAQAGQQVQAKAAGARG